MIDSKGTMKELLDIIAERACRMDLPMHDDKQKGLYMCYIWEMSKLNKGENSPIWIV